MLHTVKQKLIIAIHNEGRYAGGQSSTDCVIHILTMCQHQHSSDLHCGGPYLNQ